MPVWRLSAREPKDNEMGLTILSIASFIVVLAVFIVIPLIMETRAENRSYARHCEIRDIRESSACEHCEYGISYCINIGHAKCLDSDDDKKRS